MKVLIIDDEPLARIGMRSIIPWDKNGFSLVGEAGNGIEGLEMAKRYGPDIILVDIIMPEMDGIEFIRRVKPVLPDSKIIIMSCMNEIQYYQEAIHLGVSEYILKDKINPQEILETVGRVADELRRDRVFDENDTETQVVNKNLVMTEFMNQVLKGKIRDGQRIIAKLEQHGIKIEGRKFRIACISAYSTDLQGDSDAESLDYSVINICQEIVSSGCGGYVFRSFEGNIAAILMNRENPDGDLFLEQLFRQIKETCEQCLDCCITMGTGNVFCNPGSIYEGYLQACSAMEISFFKGRGKLYHYLRDVDYDPAVAKKADKVLQEILSISSATDISHISDSLEEMNRLLSDGKVTLMKTKSIYMDIIYHILSLLRKEKLEVSEILGEDVDAYTFFDRLDSAAGYHSRMVTLINKTAGYLRGHNNVKSNRIIEEVRRWVEKHLNEKIKLESIAGDVYLSPSYLCRLYKKETGQNLQDYILERKIEKAKELLSQYNVGTVSDLLGFNSHSYFIRVFRERTGYTPLQFQKGGKKI